MHRENSVALLADWLVAVPRGRRLTAAAASILILAGRPASQAVTGRIQSGLHKAVPSSTTCSYWPLAAVRAFGSRETLRFGQPIITCSLASSHYM